MMSKIEFLARARERTQEAVALIAGCPAEESGLTVDECLTMAMQLTDCDDLQLRFAVFEALCRRFVR